MAIIRAEITQGMRVIVEPLTVKRNWMDNVANAHAYNCFPLSLSNALGWGISFPEDIVFMWDGIDTDKEEGHIKIIEGHQYVNENRRSATLSLNTYIKFITDENTTMLTMPVPNYFSDSFIPYTTLVTTSFYPHMLPAALKIIKPNVEITIPAHTPVLSIVPISTEQINNYEMEIYDFIPTEEYELKNQQYGKESQKLNQEGKWTHFYRNATDELGNSVGKHEIKTFRLKTKDMRN